MVDHCLVNALIPFVVIVSDVFLIAHSINQSINPLVNQSINQSINSSFSLPYPPSPPLLFYGDFAAIPH